MAIPLTQDGWFTEVQKKLTSAFSVQIKHKLHEEQTTQHHIAVYASETLGNFMVINGAITLTEKDSFIQHEMLSHPALFTHIKPQKIAIIGAGHSGILHEVLKHPTITEVWQIEENKQIIELTEQFFPSLCINPTDPRIHLYFGNAKEWINNTKQKDFDIIIANKTTDFSISYFQDALTVLHHDGILIQKAALPFQPHNLKTIHHNIQSAGFVDKQSLIFAQYTTISPWCAALMAKKNGLFKRIREKDIFNKSFKTQYYNFDTHKAALALPEYIREALSLFNGDEI